MSSTVILHLKFDLKLPVFPKTVRPNISTPFSTRRWFHVLTLLGLVYLSVRSTEPILLPSSRVRIKCNWRTFYYKYTLRGCKYGTNTVSILSDTSIRVNGRQPDIRVGESGVPGNTPTQTLDDYVRKHPLGTANVDFIQCLSRTSTNLRSDSLNYNHFRQFSGTCKNSSCHVYLDAKRL